MSMQKGKHQGGQNQGFPRYPPNAYQQRPTAPQRGGDVYHVTTGYPPQGGGGVGPGGPGPSGGPGPGAMRAMAMPMVGSQASQQQGPSGPAPTSTPPGPGHGAADINKGIHMQSQGQMQGGMLPFQVTRQSTANYNFQPRAATPRMPGRNQPPIAYNMGNGQQIVPGQHPSYMQLHNNVYMPVQMYPRGGMNSAGPQTPYYPNQQTQLFIQPTNMAAPHTGLYYPIQTVRSGPSTVNLPGPPQSQQGLQTSAPHGPTQSQIIPVSGNIMPNVAPSAPPGGNTVQAAQPKRRKHALAIVDPNSGRDVVEEMEKEASASGGSSNRETPQPESLQNHNVAAEFAERVGKAASEDSTPSAPTQPPDLSGGSLNGPAPTEPSSDPSLSQTSFIDDSSSIGNSWNKGGHKGSVDLGEKLQEPPQPVYLYSPVITNFSAKNMEMSDVYQNVTPNMPGVPIMVHMGPARGTISNSLALNEPTPVVSANVNAPSVPVELYRARNPSQVGGVGSSGHPGSHASPSRRGKKQDSSAAASNSSTSVTSTTSTDSFNQYADGKKKGSAPPIAIQTSQASSQAKPQAGPGPQKEGKREKGRDKTSAPKEVPKEVALEKPSQAETSDIVTAAPSSQPVATKGKSPPAETPSTSPTALTVSSSISTATTTSTAANKTAPTPVAPTTPAAPPAADVKSEKGDKGGRTRQSSTDSSADSEGGSKGQGRNNKGKKMRDSSAKGAEKEGSDVEAAVPEESAATPSPTPTPTEPASGSSPSPVPEATPKAVTETAPRDPSPTPVPAPESTPPPAPASTPAPDAAAPVQTGPIESAAAPKTAPEPTTASPAEAAVATPAPAPAPTPALPVANPVASGASINMFSPPFALPSPPILMPKSNKDKENEDKEDKLVAARNEENAKVSGMKDDSAADKRRTYTPEQWSPVNPDGKKKYDRSFLMDLRNDPQSQKKPDGLPDMDVVLKESNKKAMLNNFSSEFSPAGFIRSSVSRGPPPQRKSQQGKPKQGKPPVVHMSLSLREDVKLHETENAWKPGVLTGGKESNEDEAKTQELYKKVRGVLNKLTPEKFDKLVGQVQALPIDTSERLKGVIDLVFDKAVDEPSFSVAYAKMCNELRTKEVQSSSFRKILITRCQQEFEKNKDVEFNKAEKLKQIEKEADPEKKKELLHAYEEEERKVRMKSVGNIRFIGELYKLGMLTGPIMLRCVSDLLSKEEEEAYECLCKLLTTIGKKLEHELASSPQSSQDVLGTYIAKMKDLADKRGKGRNVSSRVRFMLQDCIELKENKWIPRRDDSNPKTLDDIQKESERETMESNIALANPSTPGRKDDRMGGRMGGMDKRGGGRAGMVSEDGWKQAPTRRSTPLDVNKMSKSLIQQPETTFGTPAQFSKWGGGSGISAARDPKQAPAPRNTSAVNLNNSFGVLNDRSSMFNSIDRKMPTGPPLKDRSLGGERGSGSRSSSQQRTGSQPASRDSSLARGKREEEKRNRVPTPSAATDLSPSDDQPSSDLSESNESGPVCKGKRIEDPDELSRMVRNLIQELLLHLNNEEAVLAVMDHIDWTNIESFLREVLVFMAERREGHRVVSLFIAHLLKINYMRKQHLLSAFSEVLDLSADLIFDIPKLWQQLAAQIGFLLISEAVTFKDLAKPFSVLKGSKESGVLLKNIIDVLIREKGPSWIRDHWDCTWSDFLEPEEVDNFVKENALESFSGGAQASRSEMTQAEIQARLLELLKSDQSFDAVQEWIESNLGDKTKEPSFIRALMTAICENAIHESSPSGKLTLDSGKLRQDKLLLRYVDNKESLELQCLYAVQALVTRLQHPQGLIQSIFTTLWEDNLVSTEAFEAWFQSTDPQESEGRGVCRTSLASFQTLLAEVEDDD